MVFLSEVATRRNNDESATRSIRRVEFITDFLRTETFRSYAPPSPACIGSNDSQNQRDMAVYDINSVISRRSCHFFFFLSTPQGRPLCRNVRNVSRLYAADLTSETRSENRPTNRVGRLNLAGRFRNKGNESVVTADITGIPPRRVNHDRDYHPDRLSREPRQCVRARSVVRKKKLNFTTSRRMTMA